MSWRRRMAAGRQHHFLGATVCKTCWPVPARARLVLEPRHLALSCGMKAETPELQLCLTCCPHQAEAYCLEGHFSHCAGKEGANIWGAFAMG